MNEIGSQADSEVSRPRGQFFTEKRRLLYVYVPIFVFVCMLPALVLDERSPFQRVFEVVMALGLNIATFAWCRIDSRERNYELHRLFTYAVVIFGTLALLYYLFRSRGFGGGLKSTGWLLVYAVICLVSASILAAVVVALLAITGVIAIPGPPPIGTLLSLDK